MGCFALISDIHFGKFSRTEEFSVPGSIIKDETIGGESLQQGLIDILKEKKVQYIFIAGDLTSIGSPQEFYYCERKIIGIAQQLGLSENKIICCLGNHDVDRGIVALSDKFSSEEMPQEVRKTVEDKYQLIAASSAQNCCDILKKPLKEGVAPFSGIVEEDEFVVFILNSGSQCSQHQEIAHGMLMKNQLEWFNKACKEYESDSRKKIILMHHHPIQYSYPTVGLDISMIEESSQLLECAGENGINMILHGHRHHPKATTVMKDGWKKPISFICAGSLSVNAEHRNHGEIPNTMHIIEFDKDIDKIELFNYQFSTGQGWIPFNKYCPETPLDAHMILGNTYTDKEQSDAILGYSEYTGKIKWQELCECLKSINYDMLNQKFDVLLSSSHEIFGKFPETVMVVKKGENHE